MQVRRKCAGRTSWRRLTARKAAGGRAPKHGRSVCPVAHSGRAYDQREASSGAKPAGKRLASEQATGTKQNRTWQLATAIAAAMCAGIGTSHGRLENVAPAQLHMCALAGKLVAAAACDSAHPRRRSETQQKWTPPTKVVDQEVEVFKERCALRARTTH